MSDAHCFFAQIMYFFSFQAFKQDGEFRVKEYCILDEKCKVISHGLLKYKQSFSTLNKEDQKQNIFLTTNHHFICWNDGYITQDFNDILKNNLPQYSHVVVKGLQIKCFLQKNRRDLHIHDIDEMMQANQTQYTECFFHIKTTSNCALTKCIAMYNFFNKQNY